MSSEKDCIFCKIVKGEIPCSKVFENDKILAFDDINPQAPTHIIVIPKTHIAKICDITEENSDLIGDILLAINKIAVSKGIKEEGYRIVANCNKNAGQEVFHIHFHLLGGRRMTWPPG